MTEMENSSAKPPQISEMFQKFALAFKTKTIEFFAEEDDNDPLLSDPEGFTLLDSAEDFIPHQRVVVIKPDKPLHAKTPEPGSPTVSESLGDKVQSFSEKSGQENLVRTQIRTPSTQMTHSLISSLFANVSSFEASYIQLQTAHVPLMEENVQTADRALVSHLRRLSDLKRFYKDYCWNPDFDGVLPIGSCLEAQVEENQSKLRALETVWNRLQEEIDKKDEEVSGLKKKLNEVQGLNSKLSKKLSGNLNSSTDILLSIRVFDSVLHDSCRATHRFTKVLIDLMGKVGWDLDLAANSVHPNVDYTKKEHNRYAFLSYVCLGMFQGFGQEDFGLNQINDSKHINTPLNQLLDHISINPMELLNKNQKCEFSRFCEKKYQELIHPSMESSLFSNMDQNEAILNSWRSLSVFYESFVAMASSVWTLHKLAFSFDPVVEIFRVEEGVDFSMVYMEDVTRRHNFSSKTRTKVAFTVVPGFKTKGTVIQSQVYLKCT